MHLYIKLPTSLQIIIFALQHPNHPTKSSFSPSYSTHNTHPSIHPHTTHNGFHLFVAFFGATGGCSNACLAFTLNAGLHATALARTPKKLTDMLLAQGITQDTIDNQLTIIQGDIADVSAIKRVLYATTKTNNTPSLASHTVTE